MRGCAPAPQLGRDGQLKLQENPKEWAKEPEWRTIRISINKSKTTADRINPWFTVVFKISRCQRRVFKCRVSVHSIFRIIRLFFFICKTFFEYCIQYFLYIYNSNMPNHILYIVPYK